MLENGSSEGTIVNPLAQGPRESCLDDSEGRKSVTVPARPGCVAFGEIVVESIAMTKEEIKLYTDSG